jgi:uncharacterized RDD family membrane protein YckC
MNYAGFWIRSLAFLIDLVLWNLISLVPQYLIAWIFKLSAFNEQIAGEIISLFVLLGYYCWYQVKMGTTPGKQLFSIYVISEKTGGHPTRTQSVVRLFGYLVSVVIFGCGFLMAAFHPQKKTLHDLFAGTAVIRRKKTQTESQA